MQPRRTRRPVKHWALGQGDLPSPPLFAHISEQLLSWAKSVLLMQTVKEAPEQRAGAPSGSCHKEASDDRIPPGLKRFSKHTRGKCALEALWKAGFSEVYKRIC